MPAGPGPIHAGASAQLLFCKYILKHGFVEAEIIFLKLPHMLQLRRGNSDVFFRQV
ncbi:hypothetical protein EC036_11310 [Enterobacter cloacae]|nr:hypothetical protein EC036_11310 [Enterobacter cloacae]